MARSAARGSFQQLLLFAFLLVVGLLVGVSLRAVFQFDTLITQSRDQASSALALSNGARSLSERSAAMERAARQSVVLNDAVLRGRFSDAARDASELLDRLAQNGLVAAPAGDWRRQLGTIQGLLTGSPDSALDREKNLATRFRELDGLNAMIAQQVQFTIEGQNTRLADRIEDTRLRLTRQVLGASALAVVLALAFGIWLARPFKRLERAIIGLGENRLDEPIDIRGPADVRRVSQQLDWLRLRLSELDEDKARFLRHVSHELKTPLAALHEGAALLEDGVMGPLTPGQREVTQILQQNTRTLQSQIEALLRFNSAAFEARQLDRQPTELLTLLQQQVEAQRLQWQSQGLMVDVDGKDLTAEVDPVKFGVAIGNLLSNAIRFSPRGGIIRFRVSGLPDMARIDVTDDGPGIAEDERERIFEPFFRGEQQPQHAVRGTGIGLAIVQEYIAAHGGSVTLLSDGQGAHFRIELPRGS